MTNVCIVTGAAKGIGKETLLTFVRQGYRGIGIDQDQDAITQLLDSISSEERSHLVMKHMDLTADWDTDALKYEISSALPPSVQLTLVNNIGGSRESRQASETGTWDQFMDTLEFNLKPLHTMIRAVVPLMKQNQYGRIVNISSISGRKALNNITFEYPASKAAIIGLSRHLAAEWMDDNIWVNTVCPGIIGTKRMLDRWANRDSEINEKVLQTIPMNRLGTPQEVADAVYFLGSHTNTYITGIILDVNGGMLMP